MKQTSPYLWLSCLLWYCLQMPDTQAGNISVNHDSDSSLSQALERAESGDTVYVNAGRYTTANLVIDKPLVIIGRGMPTLDGDGQQEHILIIRSDHVTVDGLRFINVGRSFLKELSAIRVVRVRNVTIRNNVIENSFFGIYFEHGAYSTVEHNTILGNFEREATSGNAIHVWKGNRMHIHHNRLEGHRDGIYLEFVDSSKIMHNHSLNNLRYGLHFMFSNHDAYTDNTFESNAAGVAVMFSKFIRMHRNKFIRNWGSASYGLLLKEIYDAEITHNVFIGNSVGINAEGSTRINYRHNTLKGNGWAVKIAGACYENIFEANNFTSNAFDVSYNSKVNDNRFDGNYWSEYTGYDLDKDGLGDVPYRPVKLFSYVVNRTPEAIVLLRSLFVDIINFSEKVSPVFTPDDLVDRSPRMKQL